MTIGRQLDNWKIFPWDFCASWLALNQPVQLVQPVQLARPAHSAQRAKPVKPVEASPFDETEKSYLLHWIYAKISQNIFCLFQEQVTSVHIVINLMWVWCHFRFNKQFIEVLFSQFVIGMVGAACVWVGFPSSSFSLSAPVLSFFSSFFFTRSCKGKFSSSSELFILNVKYLPQNQNQITILQPHFHLPTQNL